MTRNALTLGLLVSVGVNVGVLGAIAAGRLADRGDAGTGAAGTAVSERVETESPPSVAPELDEPSGFVPELAVPELGELSEPGPAPPEHGEPTGRRPAGPEAGGRRDPGPNGVDGPGLGAPGPLGGFAGGPPVERLADRLGLEGETRTRFLAVQRRFFASMLANRRERQRLTLELRRELVAEQPDRERIAHLVGRLGEVYAAGEAATAESVLDSRKLLDPRQQQLYARFLRHLGDDRAPGSGRARGGGRLGRRGPPPGR